MQRHPPAQLNHILLGKALPSWRMWWQRTYQHGQSERLYAFSSADVLPLPFFPGCQLKERTQWTILSSWPEHINWHSLMLSLKWHFSFLERAIVPPLSALLHSPCVTLLTLLTFSSPPIFLLLFSSPVFLSLSSPFHLTLLHSPCFSLFYSLHFSFSFLSNLY